MEYLPRYWPSVRWIHWSPAHYNDVIMGAMASQIISLTIVYSTVYSGTDQRKHESSASPVFVRGMHRSPMNSPHKRPVTRKMFPFDDVIMEFPSQRPVTRSFDVFIDLRLNKLLSKQRWGWQFETQSRSLWRQCHRVSNAGSISIYDVIMKFVAVKCQFLYCIFTVFVIFQRVAHTAVDTEWSMTHRRHREAAISLWVLWLITVFTITKTCDLIDDVITINRDDFDAIRNQNSYAGFRYPGESGVQELFRFLFQAINVDFVVVIERSVYIERNYFYLRMRNIIADILWLHTQWNVTHTHVGIITFAETVTEVFDGLSGTPGDKLTAMLMGGIWDSVTYDPDTANGVHLAGALAKANELFTNSARLMVPTRVLLLVTSGNFGSRMEWGEERWNLHDKGVNIFVMTSGRPQQRNEDNAQYVASSWRYAKTDFIWMNTSWVVGTRSGQLPHTWTLKQKCSNFHWRYKKMSSGTAYDEKFTKWLHFPFSESFFTSLINMCIQHLISSVHPWSSWIKIGGSAGQLMNQPVIMKYGSSHIRLFGFWSIISEFDNISVQTSNPHVWQLYYRNLCWHDRCIL